MVLPCFADSVLKVGDQTSLCNSAHILYLFLIPAQGSSSEIHFRRSTSGPLDDVFVDSAGSTPLESAHCFHAYFQRRFINQVYKMPMVFEGYFSFFLISGLSFVAFVHDVILVDSVQIVLRRHM